MIHPFSLVRGGPLYRLLVRLRLVDAEGSVRSRWLVAFAWLPLMIGGAVRVARGLEPDPIVFDISVHARLLVALPLLFGAERLVDAACRGTIASLASGHLCGRVALERIVGRAERLRDSWWIEAVLLALAIAGGQLVLWGVTGVTGVVEGGAPVGAWSFPRAWYGAIALPLVQFVLYRWLWRWLIWCYTVASLARQPLAPLATHPDRAAGLSPIAWPATPFGGFALATGSVLSGAWATQLLEHRTTLRAIAPEALVFLAAMLVLAIGPLLLFSGHLYRARRRAIFEYNDFARQYTLEFHAKWIEGAQHGPVLGTPDLQSLSDLGQSVRVVAETRWVVFGSRTVIDVWLASVLPLVPLLATTLTLAQVFQRIVAAVLGGLPL